MTQQPSGWYDDPNDPANLRYWDGVVWTDHVAPKKSPTVGQSSIGLPYQVTRPTHPATGQGYGQPQPPGQYQKPGGYPAYQQAPQYGVQVGRPLPTTVDGVPLSGWWRRVGARVIDAIVVLLISLPFTASFYLQAYQALADYMNQVMRAAEAGSTDLPPVPEGFTGPVLIASLITVVVYAIYEIGLTTYFAQTVGKLATNISIRLADRPGPPPLGTASVRWLIKDLGNVLGAVPVVGFLASIFTLVDYTWPLWDVRRQALHDKAARTQVVLGKQPRKGDPLPGQRPPH